VHCHGMVRLLVAAGGFTYEIGPHWLFNWTTLTDHFSSYDYD
jgi:hypothetical protein